MSKTAFIFPGQGAQCVGMGQEIIETYEVSKKVFDTADQLLDFDSGKLIDGSENDIHDTAFTQAALLTTSVAILEAVKSLGIIADYTAGLSLGEYTALVASGVLSLEDGVKLVRQRGLLMQEAASKTNGGMAAIIGSNEEALKEVFEKVDGYVTIANYNNPKQIVIAGEKDALEACYPLFEEAKIKAIPLQVSGAFHSALMQSAADGLGNVLKDVNLNQPTVPYLTNVTGQVVEDISATKELLVNQVVSSVLWEACVRTMMADGVDTFIEIGPGKTLAGLIKKIDRKVKVISVSDIASLQQLKTYLEEK